MNETFTATAHVVYSDNSSNDQTREFDSDLTIAQADEAFKHWAQYIQRFGYEVTSITITVDNVKGIWEY